jgi:signal transduction histidine kinase
MAASQAMNESEMSHPGERTALEAVEDARRTSGLLEVTAALAMASSVSEACKVAVVRGAATLEAAAGGLWLEHDSAPVLELVQSVGYSEAVHARFGRIPLDGRTLAPVVDACQSGEPVWITSRHELETRYPQIPIERPELAVACEPLTIEGRCIGTLSFTFDHVRDFSPTERHFLAVLARHCAQAVERARLFDQEKKAHEDVLAMVSHDLKNPLGVILMTAEHLLRLDHGGAAPRIQTHLETIHRSAARMSRLVQDLADFARLQGGRFGITRSPCAPREITRAAVEMFAALARDSQLTLLLQVPPELPAVLCDGDRVIQALGNLVSNAVKVTAPGGRITVGAHLQGTGLVWFVEDSGPGLHEDDLPRIFQPYCRAENTRYEGTGLGLTIAKGIAEAHGGSIWATSQLGVGSRFSFSIPLT